MFRALLLATLGAASVADAQESAAAKLRWNAWEAHQQLEAESLFHGLKWRAIGPTLQGGRVLDIESVPNEPYSFYVAYASGGVWKTTNNGVTFKPLSDGLPTMISGDLAVDLKNPQTLWLGSGEPNASRSSYGGLGVFKSTDGGKSFIHKGLTDSDRIGRIVIDPRDSDRVFVAAAGKLYTEGGQRGVYLSEDGGSSWRQVLKNETPYAGAIDIQIDPIQPDTVYAVMWERSRRPWNFVESGRGSGVFKSTDGGENWARLNGLPSGAGAGRMGLSVSLSDPKVLYVSVDNNDNAAAEQWDLGDSALSAKRFAKMSKEDFLNQDPDAIEGFIRDNDFPVDLNAADLVAQVRSGSVTMAQLKAKLGDGNASLFTTDIVGLQIYRSNDGGASFALTHAEPLRGVTFTYGYYFGTIQVDPKNPEKIYVLGVPVVASSDGGKTFSGMNHPSVHVDHHAWWIDPNFPDRILNGNDGGVDISYDGGKSWASLDRQPVGQIYAIQYDLAEPYNVYAGLQDNGTVIGSSRARWQDRDAWRFINGGDGMQIEVDSRDNKTVYTGYQFGFYSRSGGQEVRPRVGLQESNLRFNWQTPILLSKFNQDILYMGANKLYRSMDKAETWTPLSGDLTVSKQRGDVPFGTLTTLSESSLKFGLIWAGADDGSLHVSRDGGDEWRSVRTNLPQAWVSRVEASRFKLERAYVSLTGYRDDLIEPYVFVTEDLGASWRSLRGNLPDESINVVREDPENENVLYVGTQRGVYVSIDRGKSWAALANGLPNTTVHDLKIHPREREIIIGTHGRSAWILDALPIQELGRVQDKALHLFALSEVKAERRWRAERSKWFDRPENRPRLSVPYWAAADGALELSVSDARKQTIRVVKLDAKRGINQFRFDLLVDSKLALAAEKVAINKLKADKKDTANLATRPYAEAQRLNHPLYIQPGDYTLTLARGTDSSTTEFKVAPPAAYESRAPKALKVRGKKDK